MATTEPQAFRYGQQVRIIECPQNRPDHVDQVGTVAQRTRRATTIRVHVGIAVCQATVIKTVPVESPSAVPFSVVPKPKTSPSTRRGSRVQ
jgi:hypothetical protein